MAERGAIGISREALQQPAFRDAFGLPSSGLIIRSDEELDHSLADTFADFGSHEDLWIFGYGSLVWNPIFDVAERRRSRVFGFHRSFCLEVMAGRGSASRPGLMLALDVGGTCSGIALQMHPDGRSDELRLLWRREMLTRSYRPRWVTAHSSDGPVRALTFVANHDASNYLGRLADVHAAARIASAAGPLGTNIDYLKRTYAALVEHGIDDAYLLRLLALCALSDSPPANAERLPTTLPRAAAADQSA